jgi:hypothetical protein
MRKRSSANDLLYSASRSKTAPLMLLHYLNDKPTSVETLAMLGQAVSKKNRILIAQTVVNDFEKRWAAGEK